MSYKEAMNGSDRAKWKDSIIDEMESLTDNHTWELVRKEELDDMPNIIDTKWVFKVKRDATGKLEKYKSRLCARGFNQVEGLDYEETFAPVVRLPTIRLMLSLAVTHNLTITQMDVVTAYLYSKLDKVV